MTNKNEMPVVGKRYRHKNNNLTYFCIPLRLDHEPELKYRLACEAYPRLDQQFLGDTQTFSEVFEELPPQLSQNENDSVAIDEVKVSGVEDALKELKYHVGITQYFDKEAALDDIKEAARNLINALESNGNLSGIIK